MFTLIHNILKLYSPKTEGIYGEIIEVNSPRILIKDNQIAEIITQPESDFPGKVDKTIDARGMVMLPGFVDGHTHPVFCQTLKGWNPETHPGINTLKGVKDTV